VSGSLELDRRIAKAGQAIAYLIASIPIALCAVLAVALLMVGAALSLVGIGLPILLAGTGACRALLRIDRRVANRLLHTQIPPLPPAPRLSGSPWRRSLTTLSDRALWRMVAALALRPLLVLLMLAVGLAPIALLAFVLRLAVEGIAGLGDTQFVGPWTFGPLIGVVLALFALPVAIVAIALLDALHTLLCVITSALLAPRTIPSGPVREMLAASLGDHSVTISYWLPEREVFVDEAGRPVRMPEPGSGMTWTAVERDGRRVAAIVHDAALDTSRELVHAAAAASSLAIDNERLKADLRARLEELRVSRLRIVEAADAARRRLERDLHDGAQQQLVGLALELRLLRRRVGDPELEAVVDDLAERLGLALNELRELARGIHPAILTARGLAPAIGALADRVPVPVEQDVSVEERLPPAIEAAAYFLVAEALTNVAKYAQATFARVDLHRAGHELVVTVADDGIGGADIDGGSGLRGLQDRLAAVDGTMTIDSPPGGGTRLRATLPCSQGPDEHPPLEQAVSA
jgi:signal transduction histidine kinase